MDRGIGLSDVSALEVGLGDRRATFFREAMRPQVREDVRNVTEMSGTFEDMISNCKKIVEKFIEIDTNLCSWGKNSEEYTRLLGEEGLAEPLMHILTECLGSPYFSLTEGPPRPHRDDVQLLSITALHVAWNATDKTNFGAVLVEKGLIDITIKFLSDENYCRKFGNFVFNILGVYQNTLRRSPEIKTKCHEHKVLDLLQNLMQKFDFVPKFKVKVYMILAHLMSDEQLTTLDVSDVISYIIEVLQTALDNNKQEYCIDGSIRGSLDELLYPLCALCLNDNNKYAVVEKKGLDMLQRIIQGEYTDVVLVVAAKTLWTLSFDERAKQAILEQGIVADLDALHEKAKDRDVKEECRGALWKLRDEQNYQNKHKPASPAEGEGGAAQGHIMISYSHAHKTTILRIRERMLQDGYKVWVDVDRMSGDILTRMAEAVENAYLVLVCISHQYYMSQYCRTEASLAFESNKPMIPLKLEKSYRARDWLKALTTNKLYILFEHEQDFDAQYGKLRTEIDRTLNRKTVDEPDVIPSMVPERHSAPTPAVTSHSELDTVDSGRPASKPELYLPARCLTEQTRAALTPLAEHAPGRPRPVGTWTQAEVGVWVTQSGLQGQKLLTALDGVKLQALIDLHKNTAEFLYNQLAKEGYTIVDIISLKASLDMFEKR